MQKRYSPHLFSIMIGIFFFQSTPSFAIKLPSKSSEAVQIVANIENSSKSPANKEEVLLSDSSSETPEQFLFYDLELKNNKINMFSYFSQSIIDSYNEILSLTNDSFLFSLDHTLLYQLNFAPRSFNDRRFSHDSWGAYHMDLKRKKTKALNKYALNPFKANNKISESKLPKIVIFFNKIISWLRSFFD